MKFFGIQKMTLLDFPQKIAATLFTGGCNFRCPFCQNSSLVILPDASEAITDTEVLAFLKKRQGLLDGVCVSGGEPLLQPDLPEFLRVVKQLGFAIKLDTNGSFPDRVKKLADEGLVDYIAMDIKSSPENYYKLVGIENYNPYNVIATARFLLSPENHVPFEFRTTVVSPLHTEKDFVSIARTFAGADYYLQTFRDSDGVAQKGLRAFTKEEMHHFANILSKTMKSVTLRENE